MRHKVLVFVVVVAATAIVDIVDKRFSLNVYSNFVILHHGCI